MSDAKKSTMPAPPPATVEFRLPLVGGVERLAREVLAEALESAGVVAAIELAAESHLACRGLLTKDQMLRYLSIESMRTLDMWMKPESDGGRGLPHLKIGETVRFRLSSVESWAEKYEVNRNLSSAA
jgi:hypothetical protein